MPALRYGNYQNIDWIIPKKNKFENNMIVLPRGTGAAAQK